MSKSITVSYYERIKCIFRIQSRIISNNIIVTIIYIIDCIALTVVVLMQEGKQKGLGVIGGGNTADGVRKAHDRYIQCTA